MITSVAAPPLEYCRAAPPLDDCMQCYSLALGIEVQYFVPVQLHLSHIFSYKPHNDDSDSDFRGQVKYNHVCMVVTTITYALLVLGSTKKSHTLILKPKVHT